MKCCFRSVWCVSSVFSAIARGAWPDATAPVRSAAFASRPALPFGLLGEADRHAAADGANDHECHDADDQPPARQYLCHHAPSATAGPAVPVHLTSRPGLAEPAALRSFVPEVPFFVPWRT